VNPLVVPALVPVADTVVAVPVQNPEPPPGQGEEFGKASPVALVVIIVLALVTIVLIRSMSKRIRRLPSSFDRSGEDTTEHPTGGDAADAGGDRG
jgi:hypothetical protein